MPGALGQRSGCYGSARPTMARFYFTHHAINVSAIFMELKSFDSLAACLLHLQLSPCRLLLLQVSATSAKTVER